jgi:choline transporter-like protein 2/4/5
MQQAFKDAFFNSVFGDKGSAYFYDIAATWKVLLVGGFATILIAYLYLFLIRWTAGIIVYFAIVLTFCLLVGGFFYSYFVAREEYLPEDPTYDYITKASYVILGLAGLLAVTVCCCFNALQLGIAVFKTTSQYIAANMEVFFLPAISTLVCFVWYAIWLSAAIYLYSVGTPTPREGYPFITEIMWDENVRWFLLYFFFCLLWVNAFIIGAVQFIIGASTCIWYFTVKTDTKGRGTLIHGAKWFFRYHWASIALGALIIAICQFIRICFEYFRKKLEGATG